MEAGVRGSSGFKRVPKRQAEVLTSGPHDCGFTWKEGLGDIIKVVLNPLSHSRNSLHVFLIFMFYVFIYLK